MSPVPSPWGLRKAVGLPDVIDGPFLAPAPQIISKRGLSTRSEGHLDICFTVPKRNERHNIGLQGVPVTLNTNVELL